MAQTISMIIFGAAMLILTLGIQFFLHKTKRDIRFWSGTEFAFILGILGIASMDVTYFAGVIGFALGDMIGNFAGWHKFAEEKTQQKEEA